MRAEARVVGWIDFLDDRSEPDHVEALVALGRLDEARGCSSTWSGEGGRCRDRGSMPALPRARALILAAEGKVAEALAVVDGGAGDAVRCRSRLHACCSCEASSNVAPIGSWRRGTRSPRRSRAFEALGSPPWAQRARDEIARLGLRHRGPDELTESERRIAELAASGMTNRQVAEAAFVSPKTVEANLARVYRKLGIRSRAELGARDGGGVRGHRAPKRRESPDASADGRGHSVEAVVRAAPAAATALGKAGSPCPSSWFTRVPTLTQERYEEAVQEDHRRQPSIADPADWPVDGLLVHAAGQGTGGFRVVDMWESEEAARRFGAILGPILREVGVTDLPEIYAAHTFVSA